MDDEAWFGSWVRRRRKALDLTQEELAQRVGCALDTIRKIESGARRPSRQVAERLADQLEVPVGMRPAFLQAARAELAADRLALPPVPAPASPARSDRPHPKGLIPGLPSGTITFLCTDIEGSTQLWERHPEAMRIALARHDALLRQTIAAHDGVVFKSGGDGVYAAFTRAPDALTAAVAAQQALIAEPWGTTPLPVRMVLHTGVAEERDGDYFGPPLNRAARLLAVGHGGQILLSRATQELVCDTLPPDVTLRDLGTHRLKDLVRREHIFQVIVPDLLADFPPLRTLGARSHNLPAQLTPLIGRTTEVAAVCDRLRRDDMRLLTLTGSGGMGKTRLALQAAAELLDDFADGVYFVELATISDASLVAPTIAKTLGMKETSDQTLVEGLKAYLRLKHMLLVLDNFEQILEAAPLVMELLVAAPKLKVLVTSRMLLRLYGEHEFVVPPFAVPDPAHLPALERMIEYDAIRLFIERAQAVKADFTITKTNAPAIAEICARLDGLPLAIELAAARSKLMAPDALLARLSNRLQVLTGGARTQPARQQTLRNTIDWSYQMLDAPGQLLFARLEVFVGGCTLEAAEAVCVVDGDQQQNVLDGLAALLDHNLLRRTETASGETRFVMQETIREYARDRLVACAEATIIRQQHAHFFLNWAERAALEAQGAHQTVWLDRLEQEHDNLRAALAWFDAQEAAQTGLWLVGTLLEFWSVRGYFGEGRVWLERFLAQAPEPTMAQAKALHGAGVLAYRQGDYPAAQAHYEQSLGLYRELGDTQGVAVVLNSLGELARIQSDYSLATACYEESLLRYRELGDKKGVATLLNSLGAVRRDHGDFAAANTLLEESLALYRELGDRAGAAGSLFRLATVARLQRNYTLERGYLEESLAIRRALGDKWGMAYALNNLGLLAGSLRNFEQAAARYEESLLLFRELNDKNGVAMVLMNQGEMARAMDEYAQAAARYEESLSLYRELGHKNGIASVLHNLGYVALHQGDHEWAATMFRKSLALHRELGNKDGIGESLAGLAGVAAGQRQLEWAAQLLGAADALFTAIGMSLAPSDQLEYDRTIDLVRIQLDEPAWTAAWKAGRAMALDQVVTYALGEGTRAAPDSISVGTGR